LVVAVVLAPEWRSSFDDWVPSSQLRLHDLHHVSALQLVTGEGSTAKINQALSSFLDLLTTDHVHFVVNHLQSSTMTNEEWALPKLTRCHLRTLANWTQWDAACDKQLEAHYTAGAFLDPIPCLEHVPGSHLNILCIHWTFAIKDDGTRKACTTMDGSKCAAPWLHVAIKTYALCVGQSSMKLFFAISAADCRNCRYYKCLPTISSTNQAMFVGN